MSLYTVPVSLTRNGLLVLVMITLVAVLLPFSVFTYLSFFKVLVPQRSIVVSLEQVRNPVLNGNRQFQGSLEAAWPQFDLDQRNRYDVAVLLVASCQSRLSDIHMLLSTNDKPLHRDLVPVSCNVMLIHNTNNWLVPYRLRYWVPPLLINDDNVVHVKEPFAYMDSQEIASTKTLRLDLFDEPVHAYLASIVFEIRYQGIRFYLHRYYLTSMVFGVAFFWCISSFVCFWTSLLIWQKEAETVPKREKINKAKGR